MTPQNYFGNIVELYEKARIPAFNRDNVFRGRSASISSGLEDLTAAFLSEAIDQNYKYFTDQPISFIGSVRYPDIVVQNSEGTINNLVDVKTDLGWKRNKMLEYSKKWSHLIEEAKNSPVSFKSGIDKKKLTGKFGSNLKLHIVIASLKNSGTKIEKDYQIIDSEFPNIEIYILSDNIHPNNYKFQKERLLEKINIRENEFNSLVQNIK